MTRALVLIGKKSISSLNGKSHFFAKLDIVLWCSKYGRMLIFGTINVCFCMIHSSCARNINALGYNYNYSLNDLRFLLLVLFQYDDFFPLANFSRILEHYELSRSSNKSWNWKLPKESNKSFRQKAFLDLMTPQWDHCSTRKLQLLTVRILRITFLRIGLQIAHGRMFVVVYHRLM